MPTKRCQSEGKKGYKFGKEGKCYTGTAGKKKAMKQQRAIFASNYKKKKGKK